MNFCIFPCYWGKSIKLWHRTIIFVGKKITDIFQYKRRQLHLLVFSEIWCCKMEISIQFMKIKLIFSQLWFYSLLFLAITMFSFNCSNVTYSGSASSKLAKRLTTLLPMTSLKTSSANKRNYDHILMGDLGWWVRDNGRKQKIDKRNMANLWNWMIKKIDCRQIIGHSVVRMINMKKYMAIFIFEKWYCYLPKIVVLITSTI